MRTPELCVTETAAQLATHWTNEDTLAVCVTETAAQLATHWTNEDTLAVCVTETAAQLTTHWTNEDTRAVCVKETAAQLATHWTNEDTLAVCVTDTAAQLATHWTNEAVSMKKYHRTPELRVSVATHAQSLCSSSTDRLNKASASKAADPGFDSRFLRGDFSRSSHTSDLNIATPVATLPGDWHYKVRAWIDWPGVGRL